MTDRICQRIISPATHTRNGCRCARPNFTPSTRSCSPSARAVAIDTKARDVQLADGTRHPWGALLLATGAEPIRLRIPGAELPHVHTLRSASDCRALIAKTREARRAVVIGASFIGLEVAASLRARGLDVDIVAPETRPMEAVFGAELGELLRRVHEQHGIRFHLGTTAAAIDPRGVSLHSGERLDADLVVVGISVRPLTALAETAGIAVDHGVTVDGYSETNVPGIWAVGDIARWPNPLTGEAVRIEHWVVAERQGQTAARNILGNRERFDAVPFFWTQQHDLTLSYVGHARQWDRVEIDGRAASASAMPRSAIGGAAQARGADHRTRPRQPRRGTRAGANNRSWRVTSAVPTPSSDARRCPSRAQRPQLRMGFRIYASWGYYAFFGLLSGE